MGQRRYGRRAADALALGLAILAACGPAPPATPLPAVPTATAAPPAATSTSFASAASRPPPLTTTEAAVPSATSGRRDGVVPAVETLVVATVSTGGPATPTQVALTPPAATPRGPSASPAGGQLPATATPVETAGPATATPRAATPAPSSPPGAPAARATSTAEPDSCFRSVGATQTWESYVYAYRATDLPAVVAGLRSPCGTDRWLAIWALGSIHDPATLPALRAYLTAHPAGDWYADAFDLVPLARVAVLYIAAPQDPQHTYAVAPLALYAQLPRFDDTGGVTPGPVRRIPAAAPLLLLGDVPTSQTRPDHGGETPVVFARVALPGEADVYYVDMSRYVAALPRYFELATPAPAPTLGPGAAR